MRKPSARGTDLHASVERRSWRAMRPALDGGNRKALLPVSVLAILPVAMNTVYHLVFASSHGAGWFAVPAALPIAMLLCTILCRKELHPAAVRVAVIALRVFLLTYALITCLLSCSAHISSALMLTALAAVPALFDTSPWESLLTVAPFFVGYLCFTHTTLPIEQHAAEKLAAVFAFAVGQYIGHVKSSHSAHAAEANQRLEAVNYYLYHADAPDPLTGLAGREQVFSSLNEVHAACLAGELYCNCILVEVDGFQAYNSVYGKKSGDRMLVRLGNTFSVFEKDTGVTVGRVGAATFMAVWADIAESRGEFLSEQLISAVRAMALSAGKGNTVTVSMGLYSAMPSAGGCDAIHAYRTAEKALFYAKDGGGDRICRISADTQSVKFDSVPTPPAKDAE